MIECTYGREGYEVKLLQYALWRSGTDPGKLDGIFGRRTLRALQQFQRKEGLAADGAAGKLTWAALYPYITGYTLHRVRPGDDDQDHGPGEAAIVPLDLPVVTDRIPPSHMLVSLMLKGVSMRYPFLAVTETGRSVMGRPLLSLSIGEGDTLVGIVGPHRSDGWPAVLALLRFLEDYAAAYAAGEGWARALYGSVTLHVIPLVNPDGVDLIMGVLDPLDSFYAQAQALSAHYPQIPFPQGWAANISGIDLSLQYPTNWEAARRVRFRQGVTRPGPRGYVGSEPLIAPENRALVRWTMERSLAGALCLDEGYAAWFQTVRGGHARLLSGEAGEELAILVRDLGLSS